MKLKNHNLFWLGRKHSRRLKYSCKVTKYRLVITHNPNEKNWCKKSSLIGRLRVLGEDGEESVIFKFAKRVFQPMGASLNFKFYSLPKLLS